MKITNSTVDLINFGAINLKDREKAKSDELISQLKTSTKNKDRIKSGLLDVFDRHIQDEAVQKARGIYLTSDVLQEMYLKFFEAIENIKDLTTGKLIDILNSTKPEQDALKERYRLGVTSLDSPINPDSDLILKNIITDKNLPVYLSSASEEERKVQRQKLQTLTEKTNLTEREKNLLEEKSSGKTYKQIAKRTNQSIVRAQQLIHNAVAKIQNDNNILPEKFNDFTEKLIQRYNLNIEKDTIKNILLNNTFVLSAEPERLFQSIDKTAMLLGIDSKDYIHSVLKQPTIFCQKPETVAENINKTAKILKIEHKTCVQAALKRPTIFCLKPETIAENINVTAKLLKIEPQNYVQAALRHPQLFYQKPKTIAENINRTAKLLHIEPENFTQAVLKQPQLFHQKPETIAENITRMAKLLKIEHKICVQAALKQPPLFYQKPETIAENINKTAKILKIEPQNYIQAAIKQPPLFYQKPETIAENINRTAKILKIEPQNYIQAALKRPQLFYQKPENIVKKIRIIQYYKQIQNKKPDKIIFSTNADSTLFEMILNYLVKKSDGLKSAINKNEFADYLKNSGKTYNFEIPANELAEEFIQYAKAFAQNKTGKQIFSFKIR